MRIKRAFLLCLLIISAAGAFAQTHPKSDSSNASANTGNSSAQQDFLGTAEAGVYRNGFFGFTLNFPKDWTVLNREQIEQFAQIGQDILKNQDKRNSALIEAAVEKEVLLFAVAEQLGAAGGSASLAGGARKQPNGVTSDMVAEATKKLLLQNSSLKLTKDTHQIKLGGATFSSFELENNWNGMYIYQKIFTTIRKGYSLTFTIAYKKTESRRSLENVLQSLSFTN